MAQKNKNFLSYKNSLVEDQPSQSFKLLNEELRKEKSVIALLNIIGKRNCSNSS
jgi:hypothetical protein